MKRVILLIFTLLFLAGCSALNDSLVRIWFEDRDLSEKLHSQIREGLEQRRVAPERAWPRTPSPPFQDQG